MIEFNSRKYITLKEVDWFSEFFTSDRYLMPAVSAVVRTIMTHDSEIIKFGYTRFYDVRLIERFKNLVKEDNNILLNFRKHDNPRQLPFTKPCENDDNVCVADTRKRMPDKEIDRESIFRNLSILINRLEVALNRMEQHETKKFDESVVKKIKQRLQNRACRISKFSKYGEKFELAVYYLIGIGEVERFKSNKNWYVKLKQ